MISAIGTSQQQTASLIQVVMIYMFGEIQLQLTGVLHAALQVVQGYKFNIFYPDLIDKEVAPTFTTKPDPQADEQSNTCLLVFHAGPPYEDVAFRIIAKDWEYSHKKGYKCTFERGILHLYFNFKRARYRR